MTTEAQAPSLLARLKAPLGPLLAGLVLVSPAPEGLPAAAWLVTAGAPLAEVRDLLGHSTITMTERYAHLAPENVRSAVSKLDEHEMGIDRAVNTKPSALPRA